MMYLICLIDIVPMPVRIGLQHWYFDRKLLNQLAFLVN